MANQQELIDQYHAGELSPKQMIDFEKQLDLDPDLRAESNFQSDIINGLKEVRKAELKSRLNAIDVSPGWMEFAQQSALVKSFGGIAIATLIGSGVYLYAEKQEIASNDQVAIEVLAPQAENMEIVFEPIETNVKAKVSKEILDEVSNESAKTVKSVVAKKESTTNSVTSKFNETESPTPSFNAPEANDVVDESQFEGSDLDKLPEVSTSNEKEIDVETENVNSVNIKYKYYDGKLFLSGDFDRAPYEILEINSVNGRRIYIQYLNKYYQVKTTDKLTELPEVMDQKLIQELKLLKANK